VKESWKHVNLIKELRKGNSELSSRGVATLQKRRNSKSNLTQTLEMIKELSQINDSEQLMSIHEAFRYMDPNEQEDLKYLILEDEQGILELEGVDKDEIKYKIINTILVLIQNIAYNSLGAVFNASLEINDTRLMFQIHAALAQRKIEYDPVEAYIILEENTSRLALSKREDYLSNIMIFMQPITSISLNDTSREIYFAIRDVTTWWP
jgi:hypothetical protein